MGLNRGDVVEAAVVAWLGREAGPRSAGHAANALGLRKLQARAALGRLINAGYVAFDRGPKGGYRLSEAGLSLLEPDPEETADA